MALRVTFLVALLFAGVFCQNLFIDPSFEFGCDPTVPINQLSNSPFWGIAPWVPADIYNILAHSGDCVCDFYNSASVLSSAGQTGLSVIPAGTYAVRAFGRAADADGATVLVSFDVDYVGSFAFPYSPDPYAWSEQTITGISGSFFINNPDVYFDIYFGNPLIDDVSIFCTSPSCLNNGSPIFVVGDPHILVDGKQFDLIGSSGDVFNFYSDKDVQVNARLGSIHDHPGMFGAGASLGNYITEMGVQLRNHTVFIKAGGEKIEEVPTLYIDGKIHQTAGIFHIEEEGQTPILITYEKVSVKASFYGVNSQDHVSYNLLISYGRDVQFHILLIENGKDDDGNWVAAPRRFIDMTGIVGKDIKPEGLFGRFSDDSKRGLDEVGTKAYKLKSKDIYGTDFEFNKFSV